WSVLKNECRCKKTPADELVCGVSDRGEIDEFAANAEKGALRLFEETLRPEVEIFVDKVARLGSGAIGGLLPFGASYLFEEAIEKQVKSQLRVLAYELAESLRNNVKRIVASIINDLCLAGLAIGLVVSLKQVLEALRKRIQEFILGEFLGLVSKAAHAALRALAEAAIIAAFAVIVIALLPEAVA